MQDSFSSGRNDKWLRTIALCQCCVDIFLRLHHLFRMQRRLSPHEIGPDARHMPGVEPDLCSRAIERIDADLERYSLSFLLEKPIAQPFALFDELACIVMTFPVLGMYVVPAFQPEKVIAVPIRDQHRSKAGDNPVVLLDDENDPTPALGA